MKVNVFIEGPRLELPRILKYNFIRGFVLNLSFLADSEIISTSDILKWMEVLIKMDRLSEGNRLWIDTN